jgi:hypothetical protein
MSPNQDRSTSQRNQETPHAGKAFGRGIRWRVIAAATASSKHVSGRNGKAGSGTGDREMAVRNARNKANVTGNKCGRNRKRSAPEAREGHHHPSHPKYFFGDGCDRPGCYLRFERSRRSPLQRFCCHACRRAVERVLERERRWRLRADGGAGMCCGSATRPVALRL